MRLWGGWWRQRSSAWPIHHCLRYQPRLRRRFSVGEETRGRRKVSDLKAPMEIRGRRKRRKLNASKIKLRFLGLLLGLCRSNSSNLLVICLKQIKYNVARILCFLYFFWGRFYVFALEKYCWFVWIQTENHVYIFCYLEWSVVCLQLFAYRAT